MVIIWHCVETGHKLTRPEMVGVKGEEIKYYWLIEPRKISIRTKNNNIIHHINRVNEKKSPSP